MFLFWLLCFSYCIGFESEEDTEDLNLRQTIIYYFLTILTAPFIVACTLGELVRDYV